MLSLPKLVNGAVAKLRNSTWFPYDTGNLKYKATYGDLSLSGFGIGIVRFDTYKAPYIDFLEYGTKNSQKHKGFIKNKSVKAVVDYICKAVNGRVGK
ncbi:MAG: hypothetical protein M0R51_10850 [Clostridia bacterium]|jgi:hypothetical protein|nr:hypothetical protein [Clostridia bacterium]